MAEALFKLLASRFNQHPSISKDTGRRRHYTHPSNEKEPSLLHDQPWKSQYPDSLDLLEYLLTEISVS